MSGVGEDKLGASLKRSDGLMNTGVIFVNQGNFLIIELNQEGMTDQQVLNRERQQTYEWLLGDVGSLLQLRASILNLAFKSKL